MSGLLFRHNASKREKVFTLIAIGTCFLAIYGLATKFSPSAQVKQAAWYGSALCGVFFTIPVLRDRHPSSQFRAFGPIKKLCYATLFLLLASGFSWAAIGLGAASVANSVIGDVSAARATVAAIANPNYGKGCKFSFSIRYVASNGGADSMCASEDYWATLRVGQGITVIQRRSALGTDVLGFRNDG